MQMLSGLSSMYMTSVHADDTRPFAVDLHIYMRRTVDLNLCGFDLCGFDFRWGAAAVHDGLLVLPLRSRHRQIAPVLSLSLSLSLSPDLTVAGQGIVPDRGGVLLRHQGYMR